MHSDEGAARVQREARVPVAHVMTSSETDMTALQTGVVATGAAQSSANTTATAVAATAAALPSSPPLSAAANAHAGVPVLSATVVQEAVPAMLPSPLQLFATALGRPELYESTAMPELVEEGDILYDVLRDPLVHARSSSSSSNNHSTETISAGMPRQQPLQSTSVSVCSMGMCPVLTLPRRVGVYMAHETFEALLSFYNAAVYTLSQLAVYVDYTCARGQRYTLFNTTMAELKSKAQYARVVAMPLVESGVCTLNVRVTYTDPSQTQRRLVWASSVNVEQPLTEVARTLRCVRLPHRLTRAVATTAATQQQQQECSVAVQSSREQSVSSSSSCCCCRGGDDDDSDAAVRMRVRETVYVLSVSVCNTASVPLVLADLSFVPEKDGGAVEAGGSGGSGVAVTAAAAARRGRGSLFAVTPLRATSAHTSGGKSDDKGDGSPAASMVEPGDVRSISVALRLDTAALRSIAATAPVQTCNSSSSGRVSCAVLPVGLDVLGHVAWQWRRGNGDGGHGYGATLRVAELMMPRVMDVVVLRLQPLAHNNARGDSCHANSNDARLCRVRVGQPVRVHCAAVYYGDKSSSNSVEVMLKVRPEQLAPSWLYSGGATRTLGVVQPHSVLRFALTLLPWRTGWLRLDTGIELVDARAPQRVLWPCAASTRTLRSLATMTTATAAATAADTSHARASTVVLQCEPAATAADDGDDDHGSGVCERDASLLCHVLAL